MFNRPRLISRLLFIVAAAFFTLFSSGSYAATGTIRDVQHVVILMQENRSFDHYFGALKGVHGFNDQSTLLLRNGNNVFFQPAGTDSLLPFHVPTLVLDDVRHDWNGEHAFWNFGRWDQWVTANGPATMAYYTRADLPFYYGLVDAYTVCDANYSSVMGPTFPNRLFLFTGMIDPNRTGGGPCVDNSVPASGFSWTTYPERLQRAGISWKVYRPFGDWFGDALAWFRQFQSARRRFDLLMSNSGTASVHFSVHENGSPTELPRPYDVQQRDATMDSFTLPSSIGGRYDFTCFGPNGFQRRFAGSLPVDRNLLEVASSIHPDTGCLTLALQNWSASNVDFAITDGYGLAQLQTITVPPGSIGTPSFFANIENNGWYDLTVTAEGDPQFLRRLAGHIESGFPVLTATNALGTINFPLPTGVTNPPPAFVLPDFLSPVPETNSLTIIGTIYRTNFVLIYPAWASNYFIESFVNLPSGQSSEIIVPTNFLGAFTHYRAVPLPMESAGRLFRLRR
ncbi:MAG TPA: alkaline phosphatase family protein [Verrucomicrobiae bacterium]